MIAAAALAAVGMTGQAKAGDFTHDQCRAIAAVASDVVKTIGKEKLSVEFRQSFINFLGAKLTCDGPKDILTPTGEDIDTFNTIMTFLEGGSKPIYLQRAGLRSVDPASLTANRPAEPMKRSSDLDSPKAD